MALTGAGISTESGIPDFRSPTGIWAQYDPAEYATIEAFRADPRKVWSFYALRLRVLVEAEPNDGHRALAELERAGHLSAVVTQNIDGLHQRAGSRDVTEVHGSIRSSTCLACGASYSLAELLELLEGAEAPGCTECGAIVKPDVVMFGELMPEAAIDRAYELARSTGLMLVVGSALEVWPVSQLPEETRSNGGAVAIVNRGPTSYDARAAVKCDGAAGETLTALVGELRPRRCAAERAFRDHRVAIATDTLLDLVGHARPLPDHVGGDLVMPVSSCPTEHVHFAFIRHNCHGGLMVCPRNGDVRFRAETPTTCDGSCSSLFGRGGRVH